MENYKSWSGLNKQLTENLCDELKERITFLLTRYHSVHDSYGRAAICLGGKELVIFSWLEMYHQEDDISELYRLVFASLMMRWRRIKAKMGY